ncbi:hypothetical protein HOO68_01010 [Candidatus Gracilibacteria bacterium]|nr:hypothetical protein [Candidatus Gracilibacteria bacterium]
MIRFPLSIGNTLKKYGYIFYILLIIPFLSGLYFGGVFNSDFFIGSYEKHHGYLSYFAIIGYSIVLISNPKEHLQKYLNWSIISAFFVALIAIGEHLGGGFDIYNRSGMYSMYPGRSSGTLGNPNYLAGYMLVFIPILMEYILNWDWKIKQKYIPIGYIGALLIFLGGIYVSGSYIANTLILFLLLWYSLGYFFGKHIGKQFSIFLLIISILLSLGFNFIEADKLLSFESRFILMKELIGILLSHPMGLLIGFGPDSILSYFSDFRSDLVNSYFPNSMNIDSSHNLFIDTVFQYGLLPIFTYIYSCIKRGVSLKNPYILSIILLIVFLTFNVYIITHILLLILLSILLLRTVNP